MNKIEIKLITYQEFQLDPALNAGIVSSWEKVLWIFNIKYLNT